METCKNCIFYNKKLDDLRRQGDDKILIGVAYADKHFCLAYEDGIPEDIANDVEKCRKYEKR